MVEPTTTPDPAEAEKKEETPAPVTTDTPKMVLESDLLAVKAAKEGLQTKLTEATDKLSAATNSLSVVEARESELKDKLTLTTADAEELKTVKPQLETAQTAVENLTKKVLDSKRKEIAASFGIPITSLEEKDMTQLGNYEEALKAVAAQKGTGNYATGAGGGSTAKTETALERAARNIKDAEEKRGIGIQVKEKAKVTEV